MTRSEIIELSNQLTERKGEKVLNLQSLYRFVVQDICKRQRFWWRRNLISFNLVSATPLYDLTKVTLVSGSMAEILFDEITKFTVILSANPYQKAEYVPVYDPEALIDMVMNTTLTSPLNGNNNGQPGGRYTMDTSGVNVIRIDPPDLSYQALVVGWAMPNPSSDSTNDAVPLMPAYGHNTIVAGMNAKIFKFAYGSKNEKTIDAVEEYEQGILDLAQRKQFDPNYRLQLASQEDGVRST